MDIEGGEVEIINEIDLSQFKKILFEIHFERKDSRYMVIEEKLKYINFRQKESYGRVEYWERK